MKVKQIGRIGFTVFATIFVFTHFLELILKQTFLLQILTVSGILALLFGLMILNKRAILLPLTLIVAAIVIGFFSQKTALYDVIWVGASKMRSLLPMLFVIPFVGWVLKQEDYVEDTILLMKSQLKSSRTFYGLIVFMTQIISFFLLFGSLVVVYQVVTRFFKEKVSPTWEVFKSTAVLRGFAFSTMWVVSMPSFAYTVAILDANLIFTFTQGMMAGVVGLFLCLIHLHFYEKKHRISFSTEIRQVIEKVAENRDETESNKRNPVEFAILFLSLIGFTLLGSVFIPTDLLTIIPFVIIIWVIIYFIVKGKLGSLAKEMKQYAKKGVAANSPQWTLLLSTGVLIVALDFSGLSEAAMQGVYQFSEEVLGLNFLWILPIIVMFLGFLGIGPLSVTVLISGIVLSIYLPYAPELIVLAMTLGSALSVILSPIVIPTILLSSVNQKSTFENSLFYNWKFAISFYFVVELYIQLRLIF